MKGVGIAIWLLLAIYSLLCVWFHEIRIVYWKGSDSKIGTIGYLGFSLFFWSPVLLFMVIPSSYASLLYVAMILALFIALVGYLVDVKKI